jgi:D-arabinose 1-dehydrogenase-like Zn-dependent alcohol dehydrogenase
VLVYAAAGGVGIAATQIAKHYGAAVWGTASATKHQAIGGLGVDHPVDYRRDKWERALPTFDIIRSARRLQLAHELSPAQAPRTLDQLRRVDIRTRRGSQSRRVPPVSRECAG